MNNTTSHSKKASRAHRKGFSPLPSDGWHEDHDGSWEDYKERCVHEGAIVGNDFSGEYIKWIDDNGDLHREDGPAIEYEDGTKYWMINGRLHCLDGPAIERSDGSVAFYKDGLQYTDITLTQCIDDE